MPELEIHPLALVESTEIGAGTRVWPFAHVLAGARIGRDCNIGEHCYIEGGAVLGDGVTVKNGAMVWDGVTLEDGVFVGPGVIFTNDRHPRSPRLAEARDRYATTAWQLPTLVERGAAIGAGAVVVAGVTIGALAVVAAGAVLVHDVPPYALAAGNPAVLRGRVCVCGRQVRRDDAACVACGRAVASQLPVRTPALGRTR